jgi:uncharacterized membrane protein
MRDATALRHPLVVADATRAVEKASDVNLWKIPLVLSLAACGLFAVTATVDALDAYHVIHIPVWLTMGGIDDARAILGAMLGCVSTVLALIFSVALLVLSMMATLFGPRLLYRFLKDWVTQVTIGLFMGTFVYLCLVFLVTHQDEHTRFIPQVSLITCWLLVILSFGFLVYYSHRIASSIQNPDLVARIVDDMAPAIRVLPAAVGERTPRDALVQRQLTEGAKVVATQSGYLQEIGHAALLDAAVRVDAVVHILFRPGQFVLVGEPMACVYPAAHQSALEKLVLRHLKLGRHRTMKQDFEFGIAQIVEIAIRALSPAVNDTFTGVACVDWLGDALLLAASAPSLDESRHDSSGKLRLSVRPLYLERLVRMAFDQIRQASTDNPAVSIRILDTVRRIAPRITDEGARKALLDEARAVWQGASEKVAALDRADLAAAWQRIEASPATS